MPFDASPFSGDFRIPSWFAGSPMKQQPTSGLALWSIIFGPAGEAAEEDWEPYEEEDVIPPQPYEEDPIGSGRVMDPPKDTRSPGTAAAPTNGNGNGAAKPTPWLLLGGVAVAALLLGR